MKIRRLEQKLKESGYRFHRNGKGNHRIYQNLQTNHSISICGKRSDDVKPYQLKFLTNLERATL